MKPKPFADIDKALDWLFASTNYEQKRITRYNVRAFNLDRTLAMLALLDNPHLKYPTVHVAGTKGKGSTCAMTAAILREAGLGRVGLYTSPHLMHLGERIAVNSKSIGSRDLLECISRLAGAVEAVTADGLHMKPTFFEIFTVISLLHFARKKVDAAVIEVGLGGRLDATNCVQPVVTGIAPVSFDHTAILGSTLGAIAREKAGIIKHRVPLVVGRQQPAGLDAIAEIAADRRAPLLAYGRDYLLYEGPARRFAVGTPRRTYSNLVVPLLGSHQRQNAAMAVMLSEIAARGIGIPLKKEAVKTALAELQWPGRVELVRTYPPIIVDAAHNAASAQALVAAFRESYPGRKAVILLGIAGHKDTEGVIEALAPIAESFVATTIDSPRSMPAASLARAIRAKAALPTHTEADRPKALALAQTIAADAPLIITGSFYLAGELRPLL